MHRPPKPETGGSNPPAPVLHAPKAQPQGLSRDPTLGRPVRALLAASLMMAPLLSGCLFGGQPKPTEMVSSKTYKSLFVEVDYVRSVAPRSSALDLLKQRAGERLDKPEGITVEKTAI